MTNSAKYYIWLTQALGYSNPKLKALRELYSDIAGFYNGGEYEWRMSGVLTNKDIESLSGTPLSSALDIIASCNRLGYTVMSFDDPDYPERLYQIADPPAVLYISGKLPADFSSRLVISVVGTRNATAYGKRVAYTISASLSKLGAVIVSGGAVGVDTMAHTGALEADGITLCVLGCGINYRYLMENEPLRRSIAKRGAVISEYPPGFPSSRFTFPTRNRIISGLCDGVLVVEAGKKSGSLITASLASQQDRDVFAVMGNITSPYSQGANALIKDGAVPVTDVSDILSYYPQLSVKTEETLVEKAAVHRTDIDVSDNARTVYFAVTAVPVHIDTIASACGLPVSNVLRALTELELEGLIAAQPGMTYKII